MVKKVYFVDNFKSVEVEVEINLEVCFVFKEGM